MQVVVGFILLILQVCGEFIQVGLGQGVETEAEKDGCSGIYHCHNNYCDRNIAQQKRELPENQPATLSYSCLLLPLPSRSSVPQAK